MAELVDATDSKSVILKNVLVQVQLRVPLEVFLYYLMLKYFKDKKKSKC